VLGAGGAAGGGGGADDDSQGGNDRNGNSDIYDDGGGGGGGGGGFFGLSAGGDIDFGLVDDNVELGNPDDDILLEGLIRCVGGRGGSTYNEWAGDPPVPGTDPGTPDPTASRGSGDAGGGGGGGGICLIAGGSLRLNVGEMFAFGKAGGNSPDFEGAATRDAFTQAGNGGGGLILLQDSDGIDRPTEFPAPFGGNTRILFLNDPDRDFGGDDPGVADPQDYNEMTGTVTIPNNHVYGDDPRERLFGQSAIVSEFFDTLSDRVSYSEIRVLSNAPRYAYPAGDPFGRTIRVLLDTTEANGVGFPDLSGEDSTGQLSGVGGSIEANNLSSAHDAIFPLATGDAVQRLRFARVRILFDLANEGTPLELLDSFAQLGAPDEVIADDPSTPGLDNGLGNTDVAPANVPAVAEVRVRFIP
jgi:hypothetical protein